MFISTKHAPFFWGVRVASFKAHWGPSTHMAPRRFGATNHCLICLTKSIYQEKQSESRWPNILPNTLCTSKYFNKSNPIILTIFANCLNKKQDLSRSAFLLSSSSQNSGNQPTSELCSPMRFFLDPPQWPQVWSNRYACGSCHRIRALRALAGGVPCLGKNQATNRPEVSWVVVSKIFYFHPYLGKW